MDLWQFYLIYLSAVSVVTFFTYAVDKGKAKRGTWRVSEKALLSLSFFGGALGGYLAMHIVRHKTKKWYFHFVHIVGLIWQIAVLIFLINNPNYLF